MANQITFTITVNGKDAAVAAAVEAPLETVIPKALELTKNTGRPPADWVLKDLAGNPLDVTKKIETFNFPPNTHLFLSLGAGGGGA
jgi:Protein of Unknown function (DUF2604)